jgi:CelD/BcsL family acetyltransferase involved in cellulose biosynthesis
MEPLFDLHTRRWAADGKPGVFNREGKRDFYNALSPALLNCNRLRFSWLEWNGRILACQYGFVYQGVYCHLQEGYEPAAAHWNCGVGLRAWSIRKMIEEGVREYDFLGGMGRAGQVQQADPDSAVCLAERRILPWHTVDRTD